MKMFTLFALTIGLPTAFGASLGYADDAVANPYYSISLSQNWKAVADPTRKDCVAIGQNVDLKKSRYEASICILKETPDDALKHSGFFVNEGSWVKGGSMDTGQADTQVSDDSASISGTASCGASDSAGLHAAGGQCYSYLAVGSKYSVLIEGMGDAKVIPAMKQMAGTLKLKSTGIDDHIKQLLSNSND